MLPFDQNDLRYTLTLLNHETGKQLKIEMFDLPFPCRRFYLKVNGELAKKVPVASKTAVMQQLRAWWLAH
jgi:hypothetical protein